MDPLDDLERRALDELNGCPDEASLRAWNTRYFGPKGEVPYPLTPDVKAFLLSQIKK